MNQVCHLVWEWQDGRQRCFRCGEIIYRGPQRTSLERGWWSCGNKGESGATEEEVRGSLPDGKVPCSERSWYDAFVHVLGSEEGGKHNCLRCGVVLRAAHDSRSEGLNYVECVEKAPGQEAVFRGGTVASNELPDRDSHGHQLEPCMPTGSE